MRWLLLAGVGGLAGCAQPQQAYAPRVQVERSASEYFPQGKYGTASPRVIADDSPVPRGGGKYLVGRPYSIAGKRYFPSEQPHEVQVGMASYYGGAFHGRKTANGEIFDMTSVSAAHPTMPLPSYARVTNTRNGRSIIVRVNDRGPYHGGRVMDVSQKVAEALDFKRAGTAQVRVEYVGKAGLGGSDDRQLLASLRTDGQRAELDNAPGSRPVMMASREAPPSREPAPSRLALAPPPRAVPARPRPEPVATGESVVAANPPDSPVTARPTAFAETAPMPPERPFDLGTIPGAATPIAASRTPLSAALRSSAER